MQLRLATEKTEEIVVLAVASSEPFYRVAWLINQQLGWSLAESQPICIMNKKYGSGIQQYCVFSWLDAENGANYHLVQNRGAQVVQGEQVALEPAMQTVDYWLRMENVEDTVAIKRNIKNIREMQMVHEIKPSDLKKNSKIFRIPLYPDE